MIDLGVRTRANSSSRGKAKVYFCAHPKDYIYLDEICADIFKTQDCAVYYKEDPEAAFEENDWLTFDEIALVVAPITARFLSEDGAPFATEFAFAKMMKIPVLPLMQESGLESLFNSCAKCKNMQFLDKHKKDATEIPFEEKLQKFLAAVLIGDELAEQIRAEFDGYIFLSYRKKDRKHALDVMRLIHKGDEFRDIAIWYDEYLKPGEDFNDEIKLALENSDLFTLAVTPNILEEDNYVIKQEYPAAKKLGKRILSAELLPTDRYALKRVFDGLGDPADTRDEAAFYKALSKALDGVERKENDGDPQHNYLIGLAYFSGVDVETDKPRGFKMIEDCAKVGYAPAMEKLASAYRYGEGVERDFKKAIAWQTAAVEACKRAWETAAAAETGETAKTWTDALSELNFAYVKAADTVGDYAMEGGDVETAERAYRDVVLFHEQTRADYGRFADVFVYILSIKKLGDGYRWAGKLSDAKKQYEKSIRFLEKLLEKLDDEELKLDLVGAYEDIGQIHLLLGESATARTYFEKAVALSERLEVTDATAAETMANRYVNTGATAFEFGEYSTAIDYANKALKLRLGIAEQTEEFEDWIRVAELYVTFGQIYMMMAEREQSEKYFKLAVDAFERYAREDGGVWSKGALAMAYSFLGLSKGDCGELDASREYLEKALSISEKAFEETGLERFRSETVRSLFGLCELYRMRGENEAAKEKLLRVFTLLETIPNGVPMTGELKMMSALANNSMWMLLLVEGDTENSQPYYRAVRRCVDDWDDRSFSEMTTRDAVGFCTCCNGLAKACMDEGDTANADGYYLKTVTAFVKFNDRGGAAALATFAMQAYAGIAWMANLNGDGTRAKEYFIRSFELGKSVSEPDPIACRFLALAAVGIGDSLKDTDAREAKKYYEKALEYCELPAVKEEVKDIATVLSRYLAVICAAIGEKEEAVERFRSVLDEKMGEYTVYEMLLSMSSDEDESSEFVSDGTQELMQKALECLAIVADCYIGIFGVDPSALSMDRYQIDSVLESLNMFVEMGVTDETVLLYVSYLEQILTTIED